MTIHFRHSFLVRRTIDYTYDITYEEAHERIQSEPSTLLAEVATLGDSIGEREDPIAPDEAEVVFQILSPDPGAEAEIIPFRRRET